MNVRKALYFSNHRRHGSSLGRFYEEVVREDRRGVPPDTTRRLLIGMLAHCQRSVPYYAASIGELGDSFRQNPESYLARFPILTKDVIRTHFDLLTSTDKARRHWYFNTSGGSTGEPIKLMQDREYGDRSTAITLLYSRWTGWKVGEPVVYLWGSERDILQSSVGFKVRVTNGLLNRTYLNAFRMTPEKMHEYIGVLNAKRPKLVIAYAQAAYELATFAERERVVVRPLSAIMTSAGTLYPFMREKIESVFGCNVFNRYGSREVGDMACECPAHEGLHVAPWGSYVEIVDDDGRVVPRGTDGNIVVTSLTSFVMPLIRYSIGDRGVLSPGKCCSCGRRGQILERVLGRNVDTFKAQDGTLVDGEYFTHLLYFRDWVRKFQVIQKSYSAVVYKIVKSEADYEPAEIDDITDKTKLVLGRDCTVSFELVDDIPPSASGKYRYTISDITR